MKSQVVSASDCSWKHSVVFFSFCFASSVLSICEWAVSMSRAGKWDKQASVYLMKGLNIQAIALFTDIGR